MSRQYGLAGSSAFPLDPVRLALLLLCIPLCYGQHFMFEFPPTPSQCELVNVSWSGGSPPFRIYIAQIFGQLFQYDYTDDYSSGYGSKQIPLAISSGQNYVAFMADSNGIGTGGSSEIQTSQPLNNNVQTVGNCLSDPTGQSSLDFTFTVSGQAKQCAAGFEMSWSGGTEDGPYNFTVIPLDQGLFPFDVPLERGVKSMSDWMLNMTAGTRFTITMNSAKGYGRGGVAGIYEVADSSDSSCVVQPSQSTGAWPNNLATNTLPSATLPITSGPNPSGTLGTSSGGGLSGGAIAGVVIGVLAVLIIAALGIWFLLRRRRRREENKEKLPPDSMDLGEATDAVNVGEADETAGRVEPFPGTPTATSRQSLASRGYDGSGGYYESDMSSPRTTFNPGNTYDLAGESPHPSGSGIALPLASKTPAMPSPSTSSRFASDAQSSHNRKSDLEQGIVRQPQRHQGQLRVVNHDDPSSIPTLPAFPAGASEGSPRNSLGNQGGRRGSGLASEGPSAAFRRHADAGRVQQEVVDLPPLYTDVPRDDDSSGPGERRET